MNKTNQTNIDAILEEATKEAARLKELGWKQEDFANALKGMFEQRNHMAHLNAHGYFDGN